MNNEKRETISLKLNPQLWRETRKRAIDEGISYSEYVENLLQEDLSRKPKKKEKFIEDQNSVKWVTL